MTPRLVFLKNEAGEAEGLNDPGIETFRDSPYSSVARETGQNTRDVRADTSKPVRMAFRKIDGLTDRRTISLLTRERSPYLHLAEELGDIVREFDWD